MNPRQERSDSSDTLKWNVKFLVIKLSWDSASFWIQLSAKVCIILAREKGDKEMHFTAR